MVEEKEIITKADFNLTMDTAIASNSEFVVFIVKLPDQIAPEAIVNPRANFEAKKEYIGNVYDDHMNHKYSAGVSIVGFFICSSAAEVATALKSFMFVTSESIH